MDLDGEVMPEVPRKRYIKHQKRAAMLAKQNLLREGILAKAFEDEVAGRPYSFGRTDHFVHHDNLRKYGPHLVLKDSGGRIRYLMHYFMFGNNIYIKELKRAWTTVVETGELNRAIENKRSKEFERELDRRYPEHLLLEKLLYDNRTAITRSDIPVKIWLLDPTHGIWAARQSDVMSLYRMLMSRYFSRPTEIALGQTDKIKAYPLSLNKERVVKILTPPTK